MKSLLRLDQKHTYIVLTLAALFVLLSFASSAQSFTLPSQRWGVLLLLRANSQGYLGVEVADVDPAAAEALHLKEVRGALITLIDHDAPAGKVGLKVNDVILQLDGQRIDGLQQLRGMLRDFHAGHKLHLVICRDGNLMSFEAQLTDPRVIAKDMRDQIADPGVFQAPNVDAHTVSIFHWWSGGSNLNVGATVEQLTAQMSDYLGVTGGLMVKNVVHKSDAYTAGFRAHDVILKVGSNTVNTFSDWERSLHTNLHANQDARVPVTVLRDNRLLILVLQVDSKNNRSTPEPAATFPSSNAAYTR